MANDDDVADVAVAANVANDAVVANDADVAVDALPDNEPVNPVDVTEIKPSNVVTVLPKATAVEPSIEPLLTNIALVTFAAPIVVIPALSIVTSPVTATLVGTFVTLPTSMFALVKDANFEKAIAADALTSAFTITPEAIAATPPLVMVMSPDTVLKTELEINGNIDPESTEKVLATLPSYVPLDNNPLPAVKALGLVDTTPVKPLPSPLNEPVNEPVKTTPAVKID